MPTSAHNYTIQFRKNVSDKYIIYNSLFAALPYSGIANVGALLPILIQNCEEGFAKGKAPIEIIDAFFKQHTNVESSREQIDHLFKYVQYVHYLILVVHFCLLALESTNEKVSKANDLIGT